MEKCKKLSLKKRKHPPTNSQVTKNEITTTVPDFDEPFSPEIILVDEENLGDSSKQRDRLELSNGKRTNINRLKELIQRISSTEGDGLPFPEYIQETSKECSKEQRETQLCSALSFPDLPAKYKKPKRRKTDNENGETESPGAPGEEDTQRTRATLPVQNCHLIRDRNSNYYSLQSRNQKQGEQSQSRHLTSDNSTFQTRQHQGSGNVRVNTPTSSVESYIQSSENSAPNISYKSSAQRNRPSTSMGGPDTADSFLSKDIISDCKDKSRKQIKDKFQKHNNDKSLEQNKDKFQKPHSKAVSGPVGTSDQTPSSSGVNKSTSSENKGSKEILKQCPLCQQKFSQSSAQMVIDSHIAQCLSSSEDDVIW